MASVRIAILLVEIFVASALTNPNWRIWGGEEASKNSLEYVASVRLDGAHICGGSIVGARSILTAAHCAVENGTMVSTNRFTVRVGSTNQFSGGKLYLVSAIAAHPNYSGEKNDIAVLILEMPLTWTDRIALIKIGKFSADEPVAGDSVLVAGWGQQSSNVSSHKLHSMSFSIATEDACSSAIEKKDNSIICLAHELKKGNCFGDAGNGAVYEDKLIGVSSLIVGACGSRYPDIFSNVVYYASWIESVLE